MFAIKMQFGMIQRLLFQGYIQTTELGIQLQRDGPGNYLGGWGLSVEKGKCALQNLIRSRNRFPAWRAGNTTLFDVPACQATQSGGIDSYTPKIRESHHGHHVHHVRVTQLTLLTLLLPGLLKHLQIRALISYLIAVQTLLVCVSGHGHTMSVCTNFHKASANSNPRKTDRWVASQNSYGRIKAQKQTLLTVLHIYKMCFFVFLSQFVQV